MKLYNGKNSTRNSGYKCKVVIEILIKTMQHCMLHRWRYIEVKFGDAPKDVKEGQFAVIAVKCEKPKRFMVELRCLTNPGFLRLLKIAGEEYGFNHEGAISIPCEPDELQMVLHEMKTK
ncbi:putative small auxin-up RNA [Helianthus annuus]|nr:putative small auxin-up RNA [Helianthus annuus]KAJ0793875.1 putative small auxin-up RNA [Helianthus annuus]KAJ0958471.1 putative small auxin-up RNA [Helianthus annuus]